MAASKSHKFGQIIGDMLELALEPNLMAHIASKPSIHLDKKGERKPLRKGNLVSWYDGFGNKHDLDFVLEKGGSNTTQGTPIAFIESAWRRYTKHSKNKAQEIQGAILPLALEYNTSAPFKGVVWAGELTAPARTQLERSDFVVLHFPYPMVVEAFRHAGIDASSNEQTPESEFATKITQWQALTSTAQKDVAKKLVELNQTEVDRFLAALETTMTRTITAIHVLPLHGAGVAKHTVEEAVDFITSYSEGTGSYPFVQYEIIVQYSTGTKVNGLCPNKSEALDFLDKFRTV
jgi:hypothetical protein